MLRDPLATPTRLALAGDWHAHTWWARYAAGGHADVLVSHDCPAGVDIPGLDGNPYGFPTIEIMRAEEHRTVLRGVVDRVTPHVIWHGHYHEFAHRSTVDFGYGPVQVVGLDRDESSYTDNVDVVDLDALVKLTGGVSA